MHVDTWQLEVDGEPRGPVTLPLHLALPPRPAELALKARVPLDAPLQGRELTLAVPRLQAIASLEVDGDRAVPLDASPTTRYRHHGAQRWHIDRLHTARPELDLTLRLSHRFTQSAWLDTVPLLTATPFGDPAFLAVRTFNEVSALFAMAIVVVVGLSYLLVWLGDRNRRPHGWFVLEAVGGVALPAFASGITQPIFGEADLAVLGVQTALATVAAPCFVHAYFGLRPIAKPLLVLWAVVAVYAALVSRPFDTTPMLAPVVVLMVVASAWYQIYLGQQLWRLPRRPSNVLLVTLAWPIAGLLGTAEVFQWVGLGASSHGVSAGSAAIAVVALMRVAALSREHRSSLARTDRLNEQLAARVAALEEKNLEVQRLNDELRRQIAARSSQLAGALARLADRGEGKISLAEGDTVAGRYRVIRPIASGGMGAVYEVCRVEDGQPFALKVLHGKGHARALARFAREAQIAAQIDHPSVVAIADIDVDDDGFLFIVMELVPGRSLSELRDSFGDEAFAMPVLRQIAEGLSAIHEQGIVHRDLKPANVLITTTPAGPRVKITDFGIAMLDEVGLSERPPPPEPAPPADGASTGVETAVVGPPDPLVQPDAHIDRHAPLTQTGVIMGTPLFMAPELRRGARNARPASDVFSLGVIAYLLFTGEHPLRSPDGELLEGPRVPLEKRAPWLPSHVHIVVDAALQREPDARPTALQMAEAFRAFSSRAA